jgi:hypothetical protein
MVLCSSLGPVEGCKQFAKFFVVLLGEVLATESGSGLVDVVLDFVKRFATGGGGAVVEGIDFDAPNVGVLAVLVILLDLHLHNPAAERVAVWSTTAVNQGDILPADGAVEWHVGKLYQVVVTGAGVEGDVSRSVGLVLLVVNEEANGTNLNSAQKVDGKKMWLLTV